MHPHSDNLLLTPYQYFHIALYTSAILIWPSTDFINVDKFYIPYTTGFGLYTNAKLGWYDSYITSSLMMNPITVPPRFSYWFASLLFRHISYSCKPLMIPTRYVPCIYRIYFISTWYTSTFKAAMLCHWWSFIHKSLQDSINIANWISSCRN